MSQWQVRVYNYNMDEGGEYYGYYDADIPHEYNTNWNGVYVYCNDCGDDIYGGTVWKWVFKSGSMVKQQRHWHPTNGDIWQWFDQFGLGEKFIISMGIGASGLER